MSAHRLVVAVLALGLFAATASAERIVIERADDAPLAMHWLPAAGTNDARPAVVALHGCGGLYQRDGKTFERRYTEYTQRLHAAGYHVLLPDSFGSRDSGPICAIRNARRKITAETRRADVIDAVRWLARREEVDGRRVVLLGWSHGAMTALATVNAARPDAAQVGGTVAFYPGCRALLERPFRIASPLLLLLGEKDDWTPPARCRELVDRTQREQPDADISMKTYADSYHGFDGTGPVRLRTDVPNGIDPRGAHAGGNPAARVQSQQDMNEFLARVLQ